MESGTKTLIILGAAAGALGLVVWLSRRATTEAVVEAAVMECEDWATSKGREACAQERAWIAQHPGSGRQDYLEQADDQVIRDYMAAARRQRVYERTGR